MDIEAQNISFSIQEKEIISNVYFQTKNGQSVGIIGPNGSGKSTLLKNIYRVYKPNQGIISIDGEPLDNFSVKETAQKMAVLSQNSADSFDFTVREIVLMGRAPHKKMLESDSLKDLNIADAALKKVGLSGYEKRNITTLSGGEKQRVMVARALTQQAKILILDEPTNHLDIQHQLQLMDLIQTLNITVVTALHDLNIASMYCDYLYVMKDGKVTLNGPPEEVFTEENIRNIFGVNTSVIRHPITHKIHITFLSSQS